MTGKNKDIMEWLDELLETHDKNTVQDIEPYDDEYEEVEGYEGLSMYEGIALAIERKDIDLLCDSRGDVRDIYNDYMSPEQINKVEMMWLDREDELRLNRRQRKEEEENRQRALIKKDWDDYYAEQERRNKEMAEYNRRNMSRRNSMLGGVAKNTAIFGGAVYLGYKLGKRMMS